MDPPELVCTILRTPAFRAASANRAIVAETIVFLFGGILGTLHHLYWTGTPTAILALGIDGYFNWMSRLIPAVAVPAAEDAPLLERIAKIGIIPGQIITRSLALVPSIEEGVVVSDTDQDILKMAVIERHRATGNVGLGLVQGLRLARGALATSVAHDSHNIIVVGTEDIEMLAAVTAIREMNGGLVAVEEGRVLASLPLPVAGLLSEGHMQEVAEGLEECIDAAHRLGCKLEDPFMTLSFLSLPVIPELKLTDRGLVDVKAFRFVPLFLGDAEKCQ